MKLLPNQARGLAESETCLPEGEYLHACNGDDLERSLCGALGGWSSGRGDYTIVHLIQGRTCKIEELLPSPTVQLELDDMAESMLHESTVPIVTSAADFQCMFEIGPEAMPFRYQVDANHFGEGAGGFVHRARDTVTSQMVAIKIMKLEGGLATAGIRQEVMMMSCMRRHRNIVQYLAHFENQSCNEMYVVMELIDGRELFDVVNDVLQTGEAIPESEAKVYMRQLLEAVRYLHTQGIEHGDIKLENIVLDANTKQVKLVDFGHSAPLDGEARHASQVGGGTDTYNPPEKFARRGYAAETGKPMYDGRKADMFSAGVACYVIAVGLFPRVGPDGPLYIPTRISRSCASFLRQLMAADPDNRLDADGAVGHDWVRPSTAKRKCRNLRRHLIFSIADDSRVGPRSEAAGGRIMMTSDLGDDPDSKHGERQSPLPMVLSPVKRKLENQNEWSDAVTSCARRLT